MMKLIGYISGRKSFGGVKVRHPHEPYEVAFFGGLGCEAGNALQLAEQINLAEMRRDGSGYQMRGGRRKARKLKDGAILEPKGSEGPNLARHIDAALPWGVPPEARLEIAHRFARHLRETYGCAVLYAVHNKSHAAANDAHFLITDREVNVDGQVGKKIRALNNFETSAEARRMAKSDVKEPSGSCEKLRSVFAEICNTSLADHNAPTISHKSYERQGLKIVPQQKRNRSAEFRDARIAVRELVHRPALPPSIQLRSMRALRKQRVVQEQLRQEAVPQIRTREEELAVLRAVARSSAIKSGLASPGVAIELTPVDVSRLGNIPSNLNASIPPPLPEYPAPSIDAAPRINHLDLTLAVSASTAKRIPSEPPAISPQAGEDEDSDLGYEALDDQQLVEFFNSRHPETPAPISPPPAKIVKQSTAPTSVDPIELDRAASKAGEQKGGAATEDDAADPSVKKQEPSDTSNPKEGGWSPSMANDVDRRLIRAFLDRHRFSDDWQVAIWIALGHTCQLFAKWWASAQETARAEIRRWRLPTTTELAADVESKGVKPPSSGIER